MPVESQKDVYFVQHNIGLDCVSDQPNYVEARGEVSPVEGFYCVLIYRDRDFKNTPRKVGIKVVTFVDSVSADVSRGYQKNVLTFDAHLLQKIFVSNEILQHGVSMARFKTSAFIPTFCNCDFGMRLLDPKTAAQVNQAALKVSPQRTQKSGANAYQLQLAHSIESEDLTWHIELTHPILD